MKHQWHPNKTKKKWEGSDFSRRGNRENMGWRKMFVSRVSPFRRRRAGYFFSDVMGQTNLLGVVRCDEMGQWPYRLGQPRRVPWPLHLLQLSRGDLQNNIPFLSFHFNNALFERCGFGLGQRFCEKEGPKKSCFFLRGKRGKKFRACDRKR